jgi:hypothetical protein
MAWTPEEAFRNSPAKRRFGRALAYTEKTDNFAGGLRRIGAPAVMQNDHSAQDVTMHKNHAAKIQK